MSEPLFSPAAIEAAAEYLRDTTQAGKRLGRWEAVPAHRKRKWVDLVEGAIAAAIAKDRPEASP